MLYAAYQQKKNPCFMVYTTVSPAEPPSVTSGFRVSVLPANSASPITLLCKQLPIVYVLSAHKIFTTF